MSRPERLESEVVDTKILGDHLLLPSSGLIAKSRFMKAAMTEQFSSWDQHDISKRGIPSETLIHLYEAWGKGGFGIILSGNVMVHPEHLEAAGNAVIYKPFETPERVEAFTRWAKAGKADGSLFILQISHAGRQVSQLINPNPVSASDVQLVVPDGRPFGKPTPLTKEGIDDVIDQFAYAAEFAYKTGFDGVELHGAHGYLLAQFLAPSTNKRTDEYGGSLDNRARITYQIVQEIRRRVVDPRFAVGIKINSAEFQEGGFQPEECREVCRKLDGELGLDFIELSGGTYEEFGMLHKKESTRKREAFFCEFADTIRPAITRAKLYVTGGFRTAGAMVNAIQDGTTDGIGLGRPVCEEPHLPRMIIHSSLSKSSSTADSDSETGDGSPREAVLGSRNSLVDQVNFMINGSLAGAQMGQIAKGETPLNSTDEKEVARFMVKLGEYFAEMVEAMKAGIVKPGWPEL